MSKEENNVILVPIDFTSITQNALDHAVELAKLLGHDICLLHIVDFTSSDEKVKEAQTELKKKAEEAKGLCERNVTAVVKKGNIFTDIGAVALDINAYLILMGTHGIQGLQSVFGSRALKVITNSQIPFVVVQKEMQSAISHGFKNIVLPLNLSKDSKQKLAWAIYIARMFKSTVHIVTTQETNGFNLSKSKQNLNLAKRLLLENEILYSVKIADKKNQSFSEQTIEHAQHLNANLIVVMTNEDRELSEFLIGSFEEKIINNKYQIPVMCVNPRKEADIEEIISKGRLY